MNKHKSIAAIVVLGLLLCFMSAAAGFLLIELRASNQLLRKLALAKPGIRLSQISGQLGPQMREFNDVKNLLEWGTVKDESFCKGKKLSRFYAVTPPCRSIDVYTDANDVIVYATWIQE
jgi:hypothetical protein